MNWYVQCTCIDVVEACLRVRLRSTSLLVASFFDGNSAKPSLFYILYSRGPRGTGLFTGKHKRSVSPCPGMLTLWSNDTRELKSPMTRWLRASRFLGDFKLAMQGWGYSPQMDNIHSSLTYATSMHGLFTITVTFITTEEQISEKVIYMHHKIVMMCIKPILLLGVYYSCIDNRCTQSSSCSLLPWRCGSTAIAGGNFHSERTMAKRKRVAPVAAYDYSYI